MNQHSKAQGSSETISFNSSSPDSVRPGDGLTRDSTYRSRQHVTWLFLVIATGVAALSLLIGEVRIGQIILAIECFVSILINPLVGLCLTAMAIPVSDFFFVAEEVTIPKILAVVTAASFIIHRLAGVQFNKRFFYSRTLKWYFVLATYYIILIPIAHAPFQDIVIEVTSRIVMVGLTFLVGAIPRSSKEIDLVTIFYAVATAAAGIWAVIFGAPGQTAKEIIFEDIGLSDYTLARSGAIAIILILPVLLTARPLVRASMAAVSLINLFALALSSSRATWVALLTSTALLPLVPRIVSRKLKVTFILTFIVILGVAGFAIYEDLLGETSRAFNERFISSFDQEQSAGRIEEVWPLYFNFFSEEWLTGGGPAIQGEFWKTSHNDLLGYAVEGGIWGICLFLVFLYVMFHEAIHNVFPERRLCSVMMVLFWLVVGLFGHPSFTQLYSLSIGFIVWNANHGLRAEPK